MGVAGSTDEADSSAPSKVEKKQKQNPYICRDPETMPATLGSYLKEPLVGGCLWLLMTTKNILLIQIILVSGVSRAVSAVGFWPTNYVWMLYTFAP